MKPSILALALTLALATLLVPAGASAQVEGALSPEALEISNALNCPVCQGQSVRDSNSELARQIRQLIQQKLDAGESRQQVMDYFVERYGVSILREPPKNGFVLALWWIPILALVGGAVILVTFVAQRRGRLANDAALASSSEDPELGRYEDMLRQEIRGLDRTA